jgi:pSer/pThr/pTyr-binding forkhead associated (FHA) protein
MEHAIGAGVTLIGRGSDCDLPLHAAGVSREHARIVATRDAITIEDAGSKNGTWINGTRRTGACVLKDGDEVCFGSCRTVFRAAGPDATTRTLTVTSSSRPGTTAPPVR